MNLVRAVNLNGAPVNILSKTSTSVVVTLTPGTRRAVHAPDDQLADGCSFRHLQDDCIVLCRPTPA